MKQRLGRIPFKELGNAARIATLGAVGVGLTWGVVVHHAPPPSGDQTSIAEEKVDGVVDALTDHSRHPQYPFAHAAPGSAEENFNKMARDVHRFEPRPRFDKFAANEAKAYKKAFHKLATAIENGELGNDPKILAMAVGVGRNLSEDLHARDAAYGNAPSLHRALRGYIADVEGDTSTLKQTLDKLTTPSVSNPNPGRLPGPTAVPVGVTR